MARHRPVRRAVVDIVFALVLIGVFLWLVASGTLWDLFRPFTDNIAQNFARPTP